MINSRNWTRAYFVGKVKGPQLIINIDKESGPELQAQNCLDVFGRARQASEVVMVAHRVGRVVPDSFLVVLSVRKLYLILIHIRLNENGITDCAPGLFFTH